METSLTVVLPVQNAERTLRHDVTDILEAASELTPLVDLLIVDDGSTDDTYEVAAELSRAYRQVRLVRRTRRRNLMESLREIQAGIGSDIVIVHDGASRVNPEQLRLVWKQQQVLGAIKSDANGRQGVSFADLRRPAATHPNMVNAHRRLMGFQRAEGVAPIADEAASGDQRHDAASQPQPVSAKRGGVGGIPNLPKPNLFGAISDFALGE